MLNSLRLEVTQKLGLVQPMTQEEQQAMIAQMAAQQQAARAAEPEAPVLAAPVATAALAGFVESDPSTWGNPSRNDACPCGSGEKFKHCHGKLV